MADPVSILKQIIELGLNIKNTVETFQHNREECRWMSSLLDTVSTGVKGLQETPNIMDYKGMRDAVEGLKESLQRTAKRVFKCKKKNVVLRALEADDIAGKLRQACHDIALNLSAVFFIIHQAVLANSSLAVPNNLMLTKIMEIVNDLKRQVDRLVQTNRNSTDDDASYQNKNKREAKKTDVARHGVKSEKRLKSNVRADNETPFAPSLNGSAKSASVESVIRQHRSSAIVNEESSSVSKLMDEEPSLAVSTPRSQLQRTIGVPELPKETRSNKIHSLGSSMTSKLVEVYPLKLRFSCEPNKETNQCPLTLINRTDHYVGVWITPTHEQFTCPRTTKMEPHSTLALPVTMNMHEQQPPQDMAKFEVLMIAVPSKDNLVELESSIGGKLNMDSGFWALVKKLKGEVYQVTLTAITCEPASCQIISRSTKNMTLVTSIDVHPTKPWIVTGHEGGNVSIWDYQKQKTVMKFRVTNVPDNLANITHKYSQYIKETAAPHWVRSVKFIREKWLAVGDGGGYIHVYAYTDTKLDEVKKFRAHDRKSVDSMAVHPTKTYLLSSSAFGSKIKLWDWSRNWEKIREYDVKPTPTYLDGVRSLKFNPRDTDAFACVTYDNRAKVGNIESSSLTTILKGPLNADYFFTHSHQRLMVTLSFTSPNLEVKNLEIRDLETGKVVHTLGVGGRQVSHVACHPTLPILVTMLDDGTVCFWDTSTSRSRLEKMVHISDSRARDLAFVIDTNDITRLVVTFESMIAIMEVNLPVATTIQANGLLVETTGDIP